MTAARPPAPLTIDTGEAAREAFAIARAFVSAIQKGGLWRYTYPVHTANDIAGTLARFLACPDGAWSVVCPETTVHNSDGAVATALHKHERAFGTTLVGSVSDRARWLRAAAQEIVTHQCACKRGDSSEELAHHQVGWPAGWAPATAPPPAIALIAEAIRVAHDERELEIALNAHIAAAAEPVLR